VLRCGGRTGHLLDRATLQPELPMVAPGLEPTTYGVGQNRPS
jgi:hypothetical protein